MQEFGDSLTQEEREKRRKPKPRKARQKKPEVKPTGTVADLYSALELKSTDKSEANAALVRLRQEFESVALNSKEVFVQDLNQFVDEQNSTILHIAAKVDSLDIVWYVWGISVKELL
jgi:hypothetical protein